MYGKYYLRSVGVREIRLLALISTSNVQIFTDMNGNLSLLDDLFRYFVFICFILNFIAGFITKVCLFEHKALSVAVQSVFVCTMNLQAVCKCLFCPRYNIYLSYTKG